MLALEGLLLPVDLGAHRHDRPVPLHLGDLGVCANFDAPLLEPAHEEANELSIGVRDRLREHLEHGHVASDLREERPELEPDRAATDDDEALRDLGERERAHVVERLRLGETLDRRCPDLRSGRDDQSLCVDDLTADPKLRRRYKGSLSFDEVGLSAFQECLDPGHELCHDPILPRDRLRELESRAIDVYAVVLAVGREPIRMTRVQKRLRRDAANGDADTPNTIALDEGDLRALHGRVECRDVTARTATEDRDVVRRHYEKSLGSSDASRSSGWSR